MDTLEAARDGGLDPKQQRSLCRPVTRGARAVFLAAEYDRRRALSHILHGGVIDGQPLSAGLVDGEAALDARAIGLGRDHQILDAYVGEGAPHHHVVIAAPGAVAVEVSLANTVVEQVAAGR